LNYQSQDTSPIGSLNNSLNIQGNDKDSRFQSINSQPSEADNPKVKSNIQVSPIEKSHSFAGDIEDQISDFVYDENPKKQSKSSNLFTDKMPTIHSVLETQNDAENDHDISLEQPSRPDKPMLSVVMDEHNKLPSNFSSFDDKSHKVTSVPNVTPEISPKKLGVPEVRKSRVLEIDTDHGIITDADIQQNQPITFAHRNIRPYEDGIDWKLRRDTLPNSNNILSGANSGLPSVSKQSFDSISEISK
jgi:hypothetical protein